MRLNTEVLVNKYKDNLFRIAFNVCKNTADAEDILQDVFIQYHISQKQYENEEHIKAWLIRVTINKAKNITKSFWRKNAVPLEEYMDTLRFETKEAESLFYEVMKLPDKYRPVIHLFYYEDYTIAEIARILHISESNVKVRLNRARTKLKEALKEDWDDDK